MRRKRAFVAVAIALALPAALIAALALYARFEYTLVAEVREALAPTPDPSDPIARGALLFRTRGCAGCHRLDAAGSDATIGPPLDGIGQRLSPGQIRASIIDPAASLASCPDGPCRFQMPQFDAILEPAQIDALVVYLRTQ